MHPLGRAAGQGALPYAIPLCRPPVSPVRSAQTEPPLNPIGLDLAGGNEVHPPEPGGRQAAPFDQL